MNHYFWKGYIIIKNKSCPRSSKSTKVMTHLSNVSNGEDFLEGFSNKSVIDRFIRRVIYSKKGGMLCKGRLLKRILNGSNRTQMKLIDPRNLENMMELINLEGFCPLKNVQGFRVSENYILPNEMLHRVKIFPTMMSYIKHPKETIKRTQENTIITREQI